jgi:hypothetical protein
VQPTRDRLARLGRRDREVVPLVEAVATVRRVATELGKRELVEAERRLDIRGANRDVVEDIFHATILAVPR